jgi:hypothetical protein
MLAFRLRGHSTLESKRERIAEWPAISIKDDKIVHQTLQRDDDKLAFDSCFETSKLRHAACKILWSCLESWQPF